MQLYARATHPTELLDFIIIPMTPLWSRFWPHEPAQQFTKFLQHIKTDENFNHKKLQILLNLVPLKYSNGRSAHELGGRDMKKNPWPTFHVLEV